MKYFSIFSGVEGFGLGLPKDWQAVGFSEIDKYASQVLKYRFPNVINYGDCKTIKWNKIPSFDLLTGGSPCQDFSIAGKRRGLGGSRSSLAWEFIRCLRTKKPKHFIWENVKGVMSSRGGWDFANIITAFSESGYALWWQVLNAKDFGVPQNRERIFIFGARNENPKEVFFEQKDSKTAYDTEDSIPEIGQADRIYGAKGNAPALNNWTPKIEVMNKGESQHYRLYDDIGLAPTLQSQSGMSSQKHPFIVAQRGRNPKNPKSRKSGLPTQQMLEPNLNGISNTLTGVEKDNYVYVPKVLALDLYNKKAHSDRVPALTEPHHNSLRMSVNGQVRKLLPIECERLMSFPDDWTRWGIDEKGNQVEISDSQRYRQCGNGVCSNVVRAIVKELLM